MELAFNELERLISLAEDDIKGIYLLAKTEERRGNIVNAKKHYKSLLSLDISPDFRTLIHLKYELILPVISVSKKQILQDRRNALAQIQRIIN